MTAQRPPSEPRTVCIGWPDAESPEVVERAMLKHGAVEFVEASAFEALQRELAELRSYQKQTKNVGGHNVALIAENERALNSLRSAVGALESVLPHYSPNGLDYVTAHNRFNDATETLARIREQWPDIGNEEGL